MDGVYENEIDNIKLFFNKIYSRIIIFWYIRNAFI